MFDTYVVVQFGIWALQLPREQECLEPLEQQTCCHKEFPNFNHIFLSDLQIAKPESHFSATSVHHRAGRLKWEASLCATSKAEQQFTGINSKMNQEPAPHSHPLPDPPTKNTCLASKTRKEKGQKPEGLFPLMYGHLERTDAEECLDKAQLCGFSSLGQNTTGGKEKSLLSPYGSFIAFPTSQLYRHLEPLHLPSTVTPLQKQATSDQVSRHSQTHHSLTQQLCANCPGPPVSPEEPHLV